MKTSSREILLHRIWVFALLTCVACSGGCQAVWEDLAMRPYEDAMRNGRMSPGEYQRMRAQLEEAANNPPPPSPARLPSK
jgi:hypothetical protein